MTAKILATSATLRAIGPIVSKLGLTGVLAWLGTQPCVGRKPLIPLIDAGNRTDPPVSEPNDPIHIPAATAAPEPPLEPPGIRSVFQGLRQGGETVLLDLIPKASSCIVALPTIMAPAFINLSTTAAF